MPKIQYRVAVLLLLLLTSCAHLERSKGNCVDRALFCANVCIGNNIPVVIYYSPTNDKANSHVQAKAYKDGKWRWQEMKGGYSVNVRKYSWFEPTRAMTVEQVRSKWRMLK